MFSWHGNIGREEMPRLLVLAQRRGTADKQAWSAVLMAALDSFHPASVVQAQRRDTSKGKDSSSNCGTGKGSAKMMHMPWTEASEQLLLHAVILELGGQESQEKGRCH